MLDIFQFGAIYAPTPEISTLLEDISMQQECAAYISPIGECHPLLSLTIPFPLLKSVFFLDPPLSTSVILGLYTSFHQGQTVKSWCIEHQASLSGVDIRRFVTFGVIKGFLYRVHKYPVHLTATSAAAGSGVGAGAGGGKKNGGGVVTTGKTSVNDRRSLLFAGDASSTGKKKEKKKKGAISRGSRFRVGSLIRKTVKEEDEDDNGDKEDGDDRILRPTRVSSSSSSSSSSSLISSRSNTRDHHRRRQRPKKEIDDHDDDNQEREEEERRQVQSRLWTFLNGGHCLDEICTELGMSEKDVLNRIRAGFPSPPPPSSATQIPRFNSSSLPPPRFSFSAGAGAGAGEVNDGIISSSSSLYPSLDRHRSRGGEGGRRRSEKERVASVRRGGEELIMESSNHLTTGGTGPTSGIGVGVEMIQIIHR